MWKAVACEAKEKRLVAVGPGVVIPPPPQTNIQISVGSLHYGININPKFI